jgi:UDP-N-acetylglucosamine 2-epimerase (non-hydrolysing)/GDP/UDP-N,N'-diacetylbacillosamine 2-epimerase (hydrolysing)
MVVLGDRYEIFAAAQAAMIARIPIAHIHGGEATEGAFDESIRHAVTKMSHFHFTAAETYRRRVIQMGESPDRVSNFGAPGLDNVTKLKLLDRDEFEKAIDFSLGNLSFLVTYHPVTLSDSDPGKSLNELLEAIDHFPEAKIIFTKANADMSGRIINRRIDAYIAENRVRAKVFTSMGQLLYLSAMKNTDIVIGNSSSGIVEAPAFHKPTINIGMRQQGRLKAESILDCEENEQKIVEAIRRGLSDEFKKIAENAENPYGSGNASFRIKEYLKNASLTNILMKKFYEAGNG